jgi:hypothetical protein
MDLDQLRAQTPGCLHRVHLNNAGAALMSRSTLAAMTTHLQLEAEVGGYEAAEQAREQIDVTYAALAQLLGGRSDQVALFDNSTHAWNAAFYSIPLGPGDRIRAEQAAPAFLGFQDEAGLVPDDADDCASAPFLSLALSSLRLLCRTAASPENVLRRRSSGQGPGSKAAARQRLAAEDAALKRGDSAVSSPIVRLMNSVITG